MKIEQINIIWYNNSMADVTVYYKLFEKGSRVKRFCRYFLQVVCAIAIGCVVGFVVSNIMGEIRANDLQERFDKVDYETATEELLELRAKTELIQNLSLSDEFYSSISAQDALLRELKWEIQFVEGDDNKYLEDFSIYITETDLYYICDEVLLQIDGYMNGSDSNGEVRFTSLFKFGQI